MRLMSFVAAMLVTSTAAFAQTRGTQPANTSKFEVFGGYSVASSDILEVGVVPGSRGSFSGWNGAITYFLQHDIGLTADVSGQYGSQNVGAATNAKPTSHTFLFGPKLVHATGKFDMYAHTLIGFTHVGITAPATLVPGGKATDTSMAFGVGGGLEYFDKAKGSKLGIRVMQVDYIMSQVFGSVGNTIRIGSGVIYRW